MSVGLGRVGGRPGEAEFGEAEGFVLGITYLRAMGANADMYGPRRLSAWEQVDMPPCPLKAQCWPYIPWDRDHRHQRRC